MVVLSDVLSLQGMGSVVDESVLLCSAITHTCGCD
ncbi:SapB/AmfS family lantipeptide [Nocardiopsis sp. Huas11]|nr:SapB/AmfS family lantipeptide [Nocardiopsis sp. Huas11]